MNPSPLHVRHTVLAQLGGEHFANTACRRGAGGDRIVAWGGRLLEWSLQGSPEAVEVAPPCAGLHYANGGCAVDLDGDGVEEIVLARGEGRWPKDPELVWFKEVADGQAWTGHAVASIGTGSGLAPHDIQPISFPTPEPLKGVVLDIARKQLVWYEIPGDPAEPWRQHDISAFPVPQQSGMAVGDIAGNGRPDVACGMFWAECPADPVHEPWTLRRFGVWDENGWGGMAKLALGDVDGDGQVEIVASEAEIPEARLGVFKRDAGDPDAPWRCIEIDAGLYCPHSLALADLNGDGLPDLLVGEMTAGGWSFPLNPRPRLMAYLQRREGGFDRQVLQEGWGMHEARLAPRRVECRRLLYGADEIQPQKFPNMKTHVSCWTIGPEV